MFSLIISFFIVKYLIHLKFSQAYSLRNGSGFIFHGTSASPTNAYQKLHFPSNNLRMPYFSCAKYSVGFIFYLFLKSEKASSQVPFTNFPLISSLPKTRSCALPKPIPHKRKKEWHFSFWFSKAQGFVRGDAWTKSEVVR